MSIGSKFSHDAAAPERQGQSIMQLVRPTGLILSLSKEELQRSGSWMSSFDRLRMRVVGLWAEAQP